MSFSKSATETSLFGGERKLRGLVLENEESVGGAAVTVQGIGSVASVAGVGGRRDRPSAARWRVGVRAPGRTTEVSPD